MSFPGFTYREFKPMRPPIKKFLPILISLVSLSTLAACLWDYDTLAQERAKFPTALELIAGKFPRHSPEFYQWRIDDRLAKLEQGDDKPEYYDDLAVAYDKLKQNDKAIEWMLLKKEKFNTDNDVKYKTAANLGTFYLHSRQLDQGIEQLEKAIELNPNAHFGRERYQLYLARYLQLRIASRHLRMGKFALPLNYQVDEELDHELPPREERISNFSEAVRQYNSPEDLYLKDEDRSKAVQGILGMMRFGHYDSPVLLECLGDLLYDPGGGDNNALTIAARAYLQASIHLDANNSAAQSGYLSLAKQSLHQKKDLKLHHIRRYLEQEVHEADQFYASIVADEKRWIAEGLDVEALFVAKYYTVESGEEDPFALNDFSSKTPAPTRIPSASSLLTCVLVVLLSGSIVLYLIVRIVRRWRRKD